MSRKSRRSCSYLHVSHLLPLYCIFRVHTGLSHLRLQARALMRSLPGLPCLSIRASAGVGIFENSITRLLSFQVLLKQLLPAVKTTEAVDSVLVLLANLLLLAHRLFFLLRELATCQTAKFPSMNCLPLTMRRDIDILAVCVVSSATEIKSCMFRVAMTTGSQTDIEIAQPRVAQNFGVEWGKKSPPSKCFCFSLSKSLSSQHTPATYEVVCIARIVKRPCRCPCRHTAICKSHVIGGNHPS